MPDDLYIQKPPTVRAMQWDGELDSLEDLVKWGRGRFSARTTLRMSTDGTANGHVKIEGWNGLSSGPHYLGPKDYVVLIDEADDVRFEVLPEAAFEMRYQKAGSTESV